MKSSRFKRVLIVEDDLELLESLKKFFQERFEQVTLASDGAEAYIAARGGDFDLVFTDVIMPGLSGIELSTRLRSEGHMNPIILASSALDDKLLLKALRLGINEFIEKPYTLAALDCTLARVLEMVRRQDKIIQLAAKNDLNSEVAKKERKVLGLLHVAGAKGKRTNN